jgi:phenylacetate-CoA ligase
MAKTISRKASSGQPRKKSSDLKTASSLGFIDLIFTKNSDFWKQERETQLLSLFHVCAEKVPAYKRFLKDSGINPTKIKTYADFRGVPPMSKDNYLRKHPLEDLCMQGTLTQSLVFTSTSGSTGAPFYFPRNGILDWQSSICHELFLNTSQLDKNKSTLVLVCFGMGVWIGGVITYEAFKTISERGYPLTILTPGVNKKEIFEALKNIGPKFDQIILCGYPPFMKDIIDEAKDHGVTWSNFNIRTIFAAEGFSEKFRDYILKKTGMKDPLRDTMNIYGSADLGTMAQETPLSILIRRIALKNKKLYEKLFKQATRLPTLAQFNPYFINFECVDGHLYISGNNALPLIRYEIGDNGDVMNFADIANIFKEEGLDLREEARNAGISDTITELPFVCIYERTDFSTKLYGAIIYPEYIKSGLQNPAIEKYITGKFTMFTMHDDDQNEYLEVNVELKSGINESEWVKSEVEKSIFASLVDKSAEYKYLTGMLNGRVHPRIIFWPYEHTLHFQTGIKQKWVKK